MVLIIRFSRSSFPLFITGLACICSTGRADAGLGLEVILTGTTGRAWQLHGCHWRGWPRAAREAPYARTPVRPVCPGLPWFVPLCGGLPWFAWVCPGLPWFAWVCPGLPWYGWFCGLSGGLRWYGPVWAECPVCPGMGWFSLRRVTSCFRTRYETDGARAGAAGYSPRRLRGRASPSRCRPSPGEAGHGPRSAHSGP
jgi:hypothetical protein